VKTHCKTVATVLYWFTLYSSIKRHFNFCLAKFEQNDKAACLTYQSAGFTASGSGILQQSVSSNQHVLNNTKNIETINA